jgi:hypothetical protein
MTVIGCRRQPQKPFRIILGITGCCTSIVLRQQRRKRAFYTCEEYSKTLTHTMGDYFYPAKRLSHLGVQVEAWLANPFQNAPASKKKPMEYQGDTPWAVLILQFIMLIE